MSSWWKIGGWQAESRTKHLEVSMYGMYTLEVQLLFFIGWCPNHHYFSRVYHFPKGTTIFKMVVDLQCIYTLHLPQKSTTCR